MAEITTTTMITIPITVIMTIMGMMITRRY